MPYVRLFTKKHTEILNTEHMVSIEK